MYVHFWVCRFVWFVRTTFLFVCMHMCVFSVWLVYLHKPHIYTCIQVWRSCHHQSGELNDDYIPCISAMLHGILMACSTAEICVYGRFIYIHTIYIYFSYATCHESVVICFPALIYIQTCRSGATAFTTAAKRMTPPPWHVKSPKYLTLSLLIECWLQSSKDHHTHLSHLRSLCLCVSVLSCVYLCVCVHRYNKN